MSKATEFIIKFKPSIDEESLANPLSDNTKFPMTGQPLAELRLNPDTVIQRHGGDIHILHSKLEDPIVMNTNQSNQLGQFLLNAPVTTDAYGNKYGGNS